MAPRGSSTPSSRASTPGSTSTGSSSRTTRPRTGDPGSNCLDVGKAPDATPLIHGDHVFASTGYGTGAALVRIVKGEEGLEAEEVYFLEAGTLQNHHGGLILDEGTIFTGTGHNKGFPIAVDFETGKVLWGPERTDGHDSAAVSYAEGRLYFRYQDGRMILIEARPDAFHERGTFVIPDVEKESWSHPVIAHGKLFLREQDNLFCYDIGGGARGE